MRLLEDGSELRENDRLEHQGLPGSRLRELRRPADFTFPLPDEDDTVIEIELRGSHLKQP